MRKWLKIREKLIQDIDLMVHQLVETVSPTCILLPLNLSDRLQMMYFTKQNHINPLSTHTPPPDHERRHYTLCVCVCVFPLTMSPGQWPPTNMNHCSNDAGRVHEEVVSHVLLNLTRPDMSVVPPWGGKNTVGVVTRCIYDHRGTSNQHFMHVHGCRRTEEPCSWKSYRFQGLGFFFWSFFIDRRASRCCCLHIPSAGWQALMCLLLLLGW